MNEAREINLHGYATQLLRFDVGSREAISVDYYRSVVVLGLE